VIKSCHALHITLRVVPEVTALRRRDAYHAIRAASVVTARRDAFRIVHVSIQNTHLHLIVEAEDNRALARGMQGFQISVARRINALHVAGDRRRRGRVFADRYHLVVIRSPTQMRNVLAYVLSNWKKHGAERGFDPAWVVDPYSTGFAFAGWKELRGGAALWPKIEGAPWLVVKAARSWLLTVGWERGGGAISVYELPGKRPD
jgi:REP element-mobilizing transposase RayT